MKLNLELRYKHQSKHSINNISIQNSIREVTNQKLASMINTKTFLWAKLDTKKEQNIREWIRYSKCSAETIALTLKIFNLISLKCDLKDFMINQLNFIDYQLNLIRATILNIYISIILILRNILC